MSKVLLEEQTLYDIADVIRAINPTQASSSYKPSEMASAIANSITEQTVLSGRGWPSQSLGDNGGIYFIQGPALVSIGNTSIDTGYIPNDNSKFIADFSIRASQPNLHPMIFGGRPNTNNIADAVSLYIASNRVPTFRADWCGQSASSGDINISNQLNYFIRVELDQSSFKVLLDNSEAYSGVFSSHPSFSSASSIGLFSLLVNGAPQDYSHAQHVTLYSFSIYEGDVLVHDFIPSFDQEHGPCVLDTITNESKYSSNAAALKYYDTTTIHEILIKKNNVWIPFVSETEMHD